MQMMEQMVSGMRMDLKYCERCGGLWMRERSSCLSYCWGCQRKLAEMPSRGELQLAAGAANAAAPVRVSKRMRSPRLPVPACGAEEMVRFPICEPSSGLNNGVGYGGASFRDTLASLMAMGVQQ